VQLSTQLRDLCFEFEYALNSSEAYSRSGQVRYLLKACDISRGVKPIATSDALGNDEPKPVVLAQGLRVQAGQSSRNGDCEDRGVLVEHS
jgi:hypothetical protein